jgi:hypothetical protein
LIQEQFETSTVKQSLLDVNMKKKQAEEEAKRNTGRGFFNFLSKMCSTSEEERLDDLQSEALRPIKKPQASQPGSRDTL